ncbi:trypsin CFT-1-like [Aricia agestis]|uniref:trypsin CFT-1-like n=1 Tax=Aricia agestis TaxID=91739 RepID=UPI001C205CAF|nr:trypsin CFT-1-like [Aricia agestis]
MRAIILLALVGAALAVPQHGSRIVGGEATTIQEYPYMSSMIYSWWGIFPSQACGGSLITATSVLSAAHCYHGDPASLWSVRLGSTQASSGGSLHAVSQLVVHAQYNGNTLVNDIALVRLASPAQFSANIATVPIAGANYNVPDGTQLFAIGWGTLWSGGPGSENLQHVDVNVINHQLCAERYAYLKTQPGYGGWPDITPEMLCVGILDVGGKDACQGDSGGPLSHRAPTGDVLVGITSWGFGCADPFYPGVNVRLSSYVDWVLANA